MRRVLGNKLKNRRGFSTVEIICMTGLAILVVIGIIAGLNFYRTQVRIGDDNRRVATALRDAQYETMSKTCVVKGCNGTGDCYHKVNNISIGYFDPVDNIIVGDKPQGYNEYHKMTIDGRKYEAPVNTYVIRVEYDGENYTLDWVKGK